MPRTFAGIRTRVTLSLSLSPLASRRHSLDSQRTLYLHLIHPVERQEGAQTADNERPPGMSHRWVQIDAANEIGW